ncbi:MAG: group II intron reverse transcriptase/maturase, partial [Thioalkalivibrio sp.]|nr:group II intron reverse transcriptase/maturase [Thioalkalivibrio sp.]
MDLMASILDRSNMQRAYDRVMRNKGAPGVDGMTVRELKPFLKAEWPGIRSRLAAGEYRPSPVRKVEIPKPGGGRRMLGIPTALDRLIQQAIHQVLSPLFEPMFSDHSYGFRPGRSAGQAVRQARDTIEEGHRWVVDVDLEKFFDRVNHDVLMARVARQVEDRPVLKLIRRHLQAGIMEGGVATARSEGTPQGGPLSPLLSNILLTDLDRELERRGHRFCRYADDCNIYVRSRRAGERVLASMTRFLERHLHLRVNRAKSAVDRPWKRSFLGYTVCSRKYNVRLKVADKPIRRLKANLKAVFRRGRGRNIRRVTAELAPKLRGWINYFRHADVKGVFEKLDAWIRRHLRKILWRQWKGPRRRELMLRRLGLTEVRA